MFDSQSFDPSSPAAVLVRALLPSSIQLQLTQLQVTPQQITLTLVSIQAEAVCPVCAHPSRRVHSRYTRHLADLSWAQRSVSLHVIVRRFLCHNIACQRQTFTERLPDMVEPYARRTTRLRELLVVTAFALGGEAGARHAAAWGVAISPDTLLSLLRAQTPAKPHTPRVLGVDDWSFRRGRHMGTILVDLERRVPVDLLPDSSEEAFAAWLGDHPGVEIISRDRGGAYASGGRAGAPHAIQVADRWHIIKNLGDAVQNLLTRHPHVLRPTNQIVTPGDGAAESALTLPPLSKQRPRKPVQPPVSLQRQRQLAMYEQVRRLVSQGWSVAAIARHLTLSKLTVRKYRDMETFRDGRTTVRVSDVEPYRAYVEQRWAEGCTEAKQLWLELQAQGYSGSYRRVWRFTRNWEVPAVTVPATASAGPTAQARTPRQAMWLLMRAPDVLSDEEAAYREQMCQQCSEIAISHTLVQDFRALVRERRVDQLDGWLERARASGIRELRRFALGLRNDDAAVRAAIEQVWSNGQVEGQVNKLKLVKRQMYGRAKFDLLRARVLYRS